MVLSDDMICLVALCFQCQRKNKIPGLLLVLIPNQVIFGYLGIKTEQKKTPFEMQSSLVLLSIDKNLLSIKSCPARMEFVNNT